MIERNVLQQSHDKLTDELASTKAELQKMIRLNAELSNSLFLMRKAVKEAKLALAKTIE
jgi:hypothetical protein